MLNEHNLVRVRALRDIALGQHQSLARWPSSGAFRDQRVTSMLIDAGSVARLENNVAALDQSGLIADEPSTATPSTAVRLMAHCASASAKAFPQKNHASCVVLAAWIVTSWR